MVAKTGNTNTSKAGHQAAFAESNVANENHESDSIRDAWVLADRKSI